VLDTFGLTSISNIAPSSVKITLIQRVFSIFSSGQKREHNLSAKAEEFMFGKPDVINYIPPPIFVFVFFADQAMAIRHPTAVSRLFAL
jgi:hypothetical protein